MKKALALFLVLLTLGFGGVCAASIVLSDRQDQVEVIPVEEQGDPAIAQGLELVLKNYCESMNWITTYRPGDNPTVDTVSHFKRYWLDESRINDLFPSLRANGLHLVISQSWKGYEEDESATGLSLAYRELAEDTQALEENSRIIRVKDYEPFYNVVSSITWWENGKTVFSGGELSAAEWKAYEEMEEAQDKVVEQFFRIPVLEEETALISVSKQSDGTVNSFGHEQTDSDYFQFFTDFTVYTDQAVYFTFSNRTHYGNLVDTSLIPGGYGIYCLPVTQDYDPATENGILVDQLAMVYPIDPQSEILDLHVSQDQSRLILRTMENGWYVIKVIDAKTMTTLQRLEICEVTQKMLKAEVLDYFWLDQEQDIFLLWLGEEYRFFAAQQDGSYQQELTFAGDHVDNELDLAWDGVRLALAAEYQACYTLWVHTEKGGNYRCKYDISLNSKIEDTNVGRIWGVSRDPVKLTWN